MPRITLLRDCALVLCCTLLVVPIVSGRAAQPPAAPAGQGVSAQAQVHFYFCASNQIGRGHTAYISNIFAVSKQNSSPIENEYLGFLKKRYSYPARETACFDGYQTEEEARTARQTRIKQFGQIEDKVVETPWTYSAALSANEIHPHPTRVSPPAAPEAAPAATAAQPPATAVAAAPSRHVGTYLIYCSSWTSPDVYVSDKFEVPAYGFGGKAKISGAFRLFLHEKYSLPIEDGLTPVGCGVDMGVGGAERSIRSVEGNTEANAKQGKKIVKTGWKYVGTLPPPDVGP